MGIMLIASDNVSYFADYMLITLIVLMVILAVLGIKTYVRRPNNNNQFQQTQEDVKEYFNKIN